MTHHMLLTFLRTHNSPVVRYTASQEPFCAGHRHSCAQEIRRHPSRTATYFRTQTQSPSWFYAGHRKNHIHLVVVNVPWGTLPTKPETQGGREETHLKKKQWKIHANHLPKRTVSFRCFLRTLLRNCGKRAIHLPSIISLPLIASLKSSRTSSTCLLAALVYIYNCDNYVC